MTHQASAEPEARVEFASRSDVGRVRSANEDSCATFERSDGSRLLVIADGMGGHRGGATASRTAVEAIFEVFDRDASDDMEEVLQRAVESANARVFAMAQDDRELEGMGTTVVAFVLDAQQRGTVAHVGDSRAYRYRHGQLEPLTMDHSVVAEMQRRGLISADEAAVHPRRNEILRSVGVSPEVDVDVSALEVASGDRFVLCSDGLSGVLSDEEIASVVQSEPPGTAVDVLVRMANERGGPDNISVHVLSIQANQPAGDPEATVAFELPEVGLQTIERPRLERRQAKQIAIAIAVLLSCIGVYLAWQQR